jgi:hypothetical protein
MNPALIPDVHFGWILFRQKYKGCARLAKRLLCVSEAVLVVSMVVVD